ncbi:AAA family ATPase [Acidobacteria bacterium AH-259-A15]|nr:AAA family ATPase [Acidobacteria bacterium AH-259-A15]
MRFLEIILKAYGPFTETVVDLSEGNHGLHVIYGLNEAGKTSALRGIHAALFGMEHITSDDFLHPSADLRVGARLLHSDGSTLAFLRRKGRKNTLLDLEGNHIDEDEVSPFLAGVTPQTFSIYFGIDHTDLVEGGNLLLRGRGEVGRSLFAAALGSDVLELLRGLEEDADVLFRPRGIKQRINDALKRYREERKKVTELSLAGRKWDQHHKGIERARKKRVEVAQEIVKLQAERTRLDRLRKTLPHIAKQKELVEGLEALGKVPALRSDFAEERKEALRTLEEARKAKQKAANTIEDLKDQLAGLKVAEGLIVHADIITGLYQRLGSQRKAADDLPKRHAERLQIEQDACSQLRELRPGLDLESLKEQRIPKAVRARVRDLGNRYQALVDGLAAAKRKVKDTQKTLEKRQAELELLERPRNARRLHRTIAQARQQGDLEAICAGIDTELGPLQEQSEVELKQLGPWSGTLEELEKLAVPDQATINRLEQEIDQFAGRLPNLEERIAETTDEIGDLERKLKELRLAGAVPSEMDLETARRHRDEGWQLVRTAWLESADIEKAAKVYDPEDELPEAYERSVAEADNLADRLRREAGRVARQSEFITTCERLKKRVEQIAREKERVEGELVQLEKVWSKAWAPSGIAPLSPREMRSWLAKQQRLVDAARHIRELRRRTQESRATINNHRSALAEVLEDLEEPLPGPEESLHELLERGEELVALIEETERSRRNLNAMLKELEEGLTGAHNEKEEQSKALSSWQREWASAVKPLDLTERAFPSEANAVLDGFEELFQKLEKVASLQHRIDSMQEDARAFKSDLDVVLKKVALDLLEYPPEHAAEELHMRLQKAREESARRSELEKQLNQKTKLLEEARTSIIDTENHLSKLCKEVGKESVDDLPALEEIFDEACLVRQKLEAVEGQLLEEGGGAKLEQIIDEAAGVHGDALPGQIGDLERRIKELDKRRSELDQEIGSRRKSLEGMDGRSAASEAAEGSKAILAEISEGVERYAVLRLAHSILSRQIEHYRRDNQGPLLRRASELFSTITTNSFSGLETDYDEKDEPMLVGVRPSGERVRVEGMSDGTRDQLYLSLRLTDIERHVEMNESIPLIADDILIKFDDQRAKVTLRMLADLSTKTQVVFFTHHSRLVEIAEGLGDPNRVFVHHLPPHTSN